MSDDRIRELQERVAWLEAKVDGLRVDRAPTMRRSGRCPGCDAETILHFTRVTERDTGDIQPMSLAHSKSIWSREPLAALQAYVCESCGLVEWYAKDLSKIEVDGAFVKLHKVARVRDPDGGPYR